MTPYTKGFKFFFRQAITAAILAALLFREQAVNNKWPFFSLQIITGFLLGAFCGGLCEKSCFSLREGTYGHLKGDCVFQPTFIFFLKGGENITCMGCNNLLRQFNF